jgi:hypothetical protein
LHQGRWIPEFIIAAFLLLIVGGIWLRELRSVPGFSTEQEIPVRVMTRDLATGAAFLRPGELVRLRLAGQDELPAQTFSNLHVVGLYAADGHSVAYTGELPDNVLLSVSGKHADAMLAALAQKKQAVYLEGQASLDDDGPGQPVRPGPPDEVALPLPSAPLRSVDPQLANGNSVVLVVVDQVVGEANRPLVQTHFYKASLSQVDGTYFARLDRGYADSTIKTLAEELVFAHDIYILPAAPPVPNQASSVPPE